MPNENRNCKYLRLKSKWVRVIFLSVAHAARSLTVWCIVGGGNRSIRHAEKKQKWCEATDSISLQFSQKPWKIYYVTCYLLRNWVQYLLFKRGHWCPRHACIQLRTCFAECALLSSMISNAISHSPSLCRAIYCSICVGTMPALQWMTSSSCVCSTSFHPSRFGSMTIQFVKW